MLDWKYIVVHHSATEDGKTFSWNAIRRYHIEQGWGDCGYHAGIECVGTDYNVILGRPLNMKGAHTKGMNSVALGFCFVGNYDDTPPPNVMLVVAASHLRVWQEIFNIPTENVYPHSQYADKSCPGRMFDMGLLRSLLL